MLSIITLYKCLNWFQNFRTIHLKCMKQVCEEVMVLHLGSLDYMHYVLNIRFYGLKEFQTRYFIRDIIFYVSKLKWITVSTISVKLSTIFLPKSCFTVQNLQPVVHANGDVVQIYIFTNYVYCFCKYGHLYLPTNIYVVSC